MRRRLRRIALICVVIAALAGVGTLMVWDRVRNYDPRVVTRSGNRPEASVDGTSLNRTSTGITTRILERDTMIRGRACARGWVHIYPTGALRSFTSTQPLSLGRDTIPPGTWVTLDPNGVLVRCNFPANTTIQGQLCRGTGGSKGVTTSFHPDGALETFFPPADTNIRGVNCAGGVLDPVILHQNGTLREATLAEDTVLEGRKCRKGDRVAWDQESRVVSVTGPTWMEQGLRRVFAWM